jgi:predicted enzyme related to lactoylglutathione lyase
MGLAHGTIGWADVAVPDMSAGKAFYEGVFGWTAVDGDDMESMPYVMFTREGKVVAGMGQLSREQQDAGQPPVWTPYIIVDDAKATFDAAVDAGATPLVEPMQILDAGTMAFVLDPTGAAIGLWQSGTHDGAEVFNLPDTMTWNDLATRDTDAAVAFYTSVLGYDTTEMPMGDGTYTVFQIGDRQNGGAWDMTGFLPDEMPAHWMTWFLVADCEASAASITEHGGSVVRAPEEQSVGISAVVTDPWGAVFGIIQSDQADGQPPR